MPLSKHVQMSPASHAQPLHGPGTPRCYISDKHIGSYWKLPDPMVLDVGREIDQRSIVLPPKATHSTKCDLIRRDMRGLLCYQKCSSAELGGFIIDRNISKHHRMTIGLIGKPAMISLLQKADDEWTFVDKNGNSLWEKLPEEMRTMVRTFVAHSLPEHLNFGVPYPPLTRCNAGEWKARHETMLYAQRSFAMQTDRVEADPLSLHPGMDGWALRYSPRSAAMIRCWSSDLIARLRHLRGYEGDNVESLWELSLSPDVRTWSFRWRRRSTLLAVTGPFSDDDWSGRPEYPYRFGIFLLEGAGEPLRRLLDQVVSRNSKSGQRAGLERRELLALRNALEAFFFQDPSRARGCNSNRCRTTSVAQAV